MPYESIVNSEIVKLIFDQTIEMLTGKVNVLIHGLNFVCENESMANTSIPHCSSPVGDMNQLTMKDPFASMIVGKRFV